MIGNQVILTMFDINTFIRMAKNVLFWDRDENIGLLGIQFCHFPTKILMEIYLGLIYTIT